MNESTPELWPAYHSEAPLHRHVQDPKTVVVSSRPMNPKASVSLVFGLLSGVLPPLALANLVVAPLALQEISASHGQQGGRIAAGMGFALSVLAMLGWFAVMVFVLLLGLIF